MVVKEITVRLRDDVLHDLDEVAERERIARDELLVQAVEEYLEKKRESVGSRMAEMTEAYLAGTLERHGSIDDIEIDAETVERAIVAAYGIDDPVELVDAVRNAGW